MRCMPASRATACARANNEFRIEQIQTGIEEAHARGKKFFLTSNLLPHNDKVRTYLRDIEPIIAMRA